ncbi:hypothetical protein L873DRAFT_1786416 [Choiromyces venosus 120613-1]|uniref:Uncharacterized protein n=1 Tax=Choiromyces venosus 120613-1 TaxID=1336337 RepID=A0A3N4K0N3_9PEZI|nr:hypothetical protein L873DRAFT_1786416 [Choiromyces venosus 120613-1]
MGDSYYIRIREHNHTASNLSPPRGQFEQLFSTNFYKWSDRRLVNSSDYDRFEHEAPRKAVTVISAKGVFPQKSFHIVPGDWSVPSEVESWGWKDMKFEVSDGQCIPHYVSETFKPNINTRVSWLKALAGASNISECSDGETLRPAGDPAIFWALIALSADRDQQSSQLIDMVNSKTWRSPPDLQEGHKGRIMIVEIYCDPKIPDPTNYGFPDP